MNRILIVIIVILAALLLYAFGASRGVGSGVDGDTMMQIVYYSGFLMLIAGGVFASQRNWGEAARNLAIWAVIGLGIVSVYLYRYDAQDFLSRVTAGLVPGRAATLVDENGFNTVILYKSSNGHYQANVDIDGKTVPMLVDTGASTIALSYRDAETIGLNPSNLDFYGTVMTANGPARTAYATLPTVTIGGITRRNIRAGIAEQGKLGQSLLGMNFLETLGSVSFSGDELRLRD